MSKFKINVLEGLQAHFKQEQGASRLATDWAVSLEEENTKQTVFVRTYNDESAFASDQQILNAITSFILDKISHGWSVMDYKFEPGELTVPPSYFLSSSSKNMPDRPWWKFW